MPTLDSEDQIRDRVGNKVRQRPALPDKAAKDKTLAEELVSTDDPSSADLRERLTKSDAGTREQTLQYLQSHAGNQSVQRAFDSSQDKGTPDHPGLVPFGSAPVPRASLQESESRLASAQERSTGRELSVAERSLLARRGSHSLEEEVRIHRGEEADEITSLLGARAATSGKDIYVASDQPEIGTNSGHRLIAHELAHVAQTGGIRGSGPLVGARNNDHERQANAFSEGPGADALIPVGRVYATAPSFQREPRAFPPDATAMVFVPTLDSSSVMQYLGANSNVTMEAISGDKDGNMLEDARGNPRGWVMDHFTSNFFASKRGDASDEFVWDPGILYADCGMTISLALLQDEMKPIGAGRGTTIKSGDETTSSRGTSLSTKSDVSADVGGEAGGKEGKGKAGAKAGTSTTIGSHGGIESKGAREAEVGSAQQVFTANLYVQVHLAFRVFDSFRQINHWTKDSPPLSVGGARFTRPSLEVVAPGAAGEGEK